MGRQAILLHETAVAQAAHELGLDTLRVAQELFRKVVFVLVRRQLQATFEDLAAELTGNSPATVFLGVDRDVLDGVVVLGTDQAFGGLGRGEELTKDSSVILNQ